MELKYNLAGAERKPLVQAISEFTGIKAVYLRTPTYAYQIGNFVVNREGNLVVEDSLETEQVKSLIRYLEEMGFTVEMPKTMENTPTEQTGVCISMPRSLFTDTAIDNLKNILVAKGRLIRKALGVADLPLEISEDRVSFPWFHSTPSPGELKAYDSFICRLCEMARTQKRVVAKEKETNSDKYAFRCFLLRLGFIGAEFKAERKILLHNLSGSSAFKGGQPKEVES